MNSHFLILDNIENKPNVISLFKMAAVTNIDKLLLCGKTEARSVRVGQESLPDGSEMSPVYEGTRYDIKYEWFRKTEEAIHYAKNLGYRIVALELKDGAISHTEYPFPNQTALVVGNERLGIPPKVLRLCDDFVYIQQRQNKVFSLNVAIATSVIVFNHSTFVDG